MNELREVFDRYLEFDGIQLGAIRRAVTDGDDEALTELDAPAPSGARSWLCEDMLSALPPIGAWDDTCRRAVRVVARIGRRSSPTAGPHLLAGIGLWFGGFSAAEPEGADWFAELRDAAQLDPREAASVAAASLQRTFGDRVSSAGRFLVSLPDEQIGHLLPLMAWPQAGSEVSALMRLFLRLAPARLGVLEDRWHAVWEHQTRPLLHTMLATRDPFVVGLVAKLAGADPEPTLARALAHVTGRRRDTEAVLRELFATWRRRRRVPPSTTQAIEGFVLDADATDSSSANGLLQHEAEFELAAALPIELQSDVDRRALAVLVRTRASRALVQWAEAGVPFEGEDDDAYGKASAAIEDAGLPRDEWLEATARFATRYTGVAARPTSLGRRALGLTPEDLGRFVEAAMRWSGGLPALTFLAHSERRAEVLGTLASLRGLDVGWRRILLIRHLCDACPEQFGPVAAELADDVSACFEPADLDRPDLKRRLVEYEWDLRTSLARHDRAARPAATERAWALARDPDAPRRGEAVQWLIRNVGSEALPELLALFQRTSGHRTTTYTCVPALVAAFGRNAWPVIEWQLSHTELRFRLGGLGDLIRFDDGTHAERIERELRALLAEKPVRRGPDPRRAAIGLALAWNLTRVDDAVAALLRASSKPLRHQAAAVLAAHPLGDRFEQGVALLGHKRAAARLGGIALLERLDDARVPEALELRLEDEASEDVRDALLLALRERWAATGVEIGWDRIQRRIDRSTTPSALVPWLKLESLPPLFLRDGRKLDEAAVHYLLRRQARVRGVMPDVEAVDLYRLIDRARSGAFARSLLESYLDGGALAEEGWVLAVVRALGCDESVVRLRRAIDELVGDRRGALAEHAVRALAGIGTDAALHATDNVALSYPVKPKNLASVAEQALEDAAAEAGLTVEELRDRIVPDLGFTPGSPRIVAAGTKSIVVGLDDEFHVTLHDARTGKSVRSPPRAVSDADKDAIRQLRTQAPLAARTQAARFEAHLVAGRRWSFGELTERMLPHPLLRPFLTRLVWHQHGPGASLTFRRDAERFIDHDDGAVTLEPTATFEIAHPLELDPADVARWREHNERHGIQPPFPQLERAVVRPDARDADDEAFHAFVGAEAPAARVGREMLRRGWRAVGRSSGNVGCFQRRFMGSTDVTARLAMDEMPVTAEFGTLARFGELVFWRGVEPGPRLQLRDVPPRAFSEAVFDLQRISGRMLEGSANSLARS